jgi:hypothetical protein
MGNGIDFVNDVGGYDRCIGQSSICYIVCFSFRRISAYTQFCTVRDFVAISP